MAKKHTKWLENGFYIMMGVLVGLILSFFYLASVIINFLQYLSNFPTLFLWSFVILTLSFFGILSTQKRLEDSFVLLFKYIAVVVSAILTLQAVWPVFIPKVNIEPVSVFYGEINYDIGERKDFKSGIFEIDVKPPLLPYFGNEVKIPIAITNLTHVNYVERSPLFSDISISPPNYLRFHILGDGFVYDTLSAKIAYKGDVTPPLKLYVNDYGFHRQKDNDGFFYYDNLRVQNTEDFRVCVRNFIYHIDNYIISDLISIKPKSNITVSLCDNINRTSCSAVNVIDAYGNSSFQLTPSMLANNASIRIGWDCFEGNSTTTRTLIFRPYGGYLSPPWERYSVRGNIFLNGRLTDGDVIVINKRTGERLNDSSTDWYYFELMNMPSGYYKNDDIEISATIRNETFYVSQATNIKVNATKGWDEKDIEITWV